jgi:hypothetical protein
MEFKTDSREAFFSRSVIDCARPFAATCIQAATMKNINNLIKRKVFRNAWLPVWFITAQTIPLAVKCILLFGWVNNVPAGTLQEEQHGSFGFSSIRNRFGM